MFQWHCYNGWLNPEARKSVLYRVSQVGGTLPAPLFLFLAGISSALVTEKLLQKGVPRNSIAKTTIRRGAEIFGLGLLFRVQEFVLGYPGSPWTDLLRVDILNILGLSMILMSVLCWLTAGETVSALPAQDARAALNSRGVPDARAVVDSREVLARMHRRTVVAALAIAAFVVMVTPLLWTTHRLRWLAWPLESYVNGVHIFREPQPWLFPLFPWTAFAFVGLAVGFVLFSDLAKRKEVQLFVALGAAGLLAFALAILFDEAPLRLYPAAIYDYWHTSPNFFLLRCGVLLVILFLSYAWCCWGFAQRGFSPVIQLGKTSLLVYWAHIEFVYGRFSILPKGRCGFPAATAGLLAIFIAMVALSIVKTRWSRRRAKASQETAATTVAATPGS
jgi:uncharacterized membrane protein